MILAISKIYYPGWQSSQAWRYQKRADAVERLRIDLLKKAKTREEYEKMVGESYDTGIIIDKLA